MIPPLPCAGPNSRCRPVLPLVIAGCALVAGTSHAVSAQEFRFTPTLQPELRGSLAVAERASASIAAGSNVPAGYYVRVGSVVAVAREFGADHATVWRAELTGRFLVDPFAEWRWGPYAGGGVAADWRAGRAGRAALLLIAGTDLPSRAAWRPAVELSVGGGARLALVLKRARTSGR